MNLGLTQMSIGNIVLFCVIKFWSEKNKGKRPHQDLFTVRAFTFMTTALLA